MGKIIIIRDENTIPNMKVQDRMPLSAPEDHSNIIIRGQGVNSGMCGGWFQGSHYPNLGTPLF